MTGVQEVWPGCLIQWEDFKQHNALRILDRYRDRVPSFNDDVQGTAAVVLAGVLAALRHLGQPMASQRILLVGAGAAGIGIARLLRAEMADVGMPMRRSPEPLLLVDSRGLVHADRADLDETKRPLAVPREAAVALGLTVEDDLLTTIRALPADHPGRHDGRGRDLLGGGRPRDGVPRDGPADRHAALESDGHRRGHAGRRRALDRWARAHRHRQPVPAG